MGQDFHSSDLDGVKFHLVPLGGEVKGFVYVSRKNVSHVFIDDSLSKECTAETIAHETYHLAHDHGTCGIGIDMQQTETEVKANKFASQNVGRVCRLMSPTAI